MYKQNHQLKNSSSKSILQEFLKLNKNLRRSVMLRLKLRKLKKLLKCKRARPLRR
jgi:hypothetical protein